jgi:hypothetical protein
MVTLGVKLVLTLILEETEDEGETEDEKLGLILTVELTLGLEVKLGVKLELGLKLELTVFEEVSETDTLGLTLDEILGVVDALIL